jgi:hypothetical protein
MQKEKSSPKKKGRKPGTIGYSEGDLEGLLESVRVVQPVIDAEWDKVADHYNTTYASKWHCAECPANGLKAKFCELACDASTGGGGRSTFEKEAKEIEHAIDKKAGVIVDGKMLEDIRKDELGRDEKKEESSDPTPPQTDKNGFLKKISPSPR